MAKRTEILATSATFAESFKSYGLDWAAEWLAITNPTQYTIAVRVGSQSRPVGQSDATFTVPPTTLMSFPVNGKEYGILATVPALLAPPDGMPTVVTLLWGKGEPPPVFGSVPLSGQPPAEDFLIAAQNPRMAGTYNDVWNLPPDVRTVEVSTAGGGITNFSISGTQSGLLYFQSSNGFFVGTLGGKTPVIPINRDLDSQLTVSTISTSVVNAYRITGFRDRMQRGVYLPSMRQLVDPGPPNPDFANSGIANAPGLGQVIVTTGPNLIAGDYRIEVSVHCNQAAGNGLHAVIGIGPTTLWVVYPCNYQHVISRVTLGAGATVSVQNNLAIAATQLSAYIAVYRLSQG